MVVMVVVMVDLAVAAVGVATIVLEDLVALGTTLVVAVTQVLMLLVVMVDRIQVVELVRMGGHLEGAHQAAQVS
jgi:hypothetical protein